MCSTVYDPVCGYKGTTCKGDDCQQTFTNSCVACISSDIKYIIHGECPAATPIKPPKDTKPKNKCSNFKGNCKGFCTKEYMPVCGYKDKNTFATYPNECFACSDKNVSWSTEGPCIDDGKNLKKEKPVAVAKIDFDFCSDEDREGSCKNDSVAVCAWKYNKESSSPYAEYKNRCQACKVKENACVINKKCKDVDFAAITKNFYGVFEIDP